MSLCSILIGASLKGKNTLPMGSVFFPLIVAPFKTSFFNMETEQLYRSKVGLSVKIQMYQHVFHLFEFKSVFLSLLFWRFLFISPIVPN